MEGSVEVFRRFLRRIVSEGGNNNFVIFEVKCGNRKVFVQFAGWRGKAYVLLDIPLYQLSDSEVLRLKKLLAQYPTWKPEELHYMDGSSVESINGYITVDEAAEVADKVFREIFGCRGKYKVNVELNLE